MCFRGNSPCNEKLLNFLCPKSKWFSGDLSFRSSRSLNSVLLGVKALTQALRDQYVAEAREQRVTELDDVLHLIIVPCKIKTSQYFSKMKRSLKQNLRLKNVKKLRNAFVSSLYQ